MNLNNNIDSSYSPGHSKMIPVSTVAIILGVNVPRATKWLKENEIPIHPFLKGGRVFQIEVDIAIDTMRAKDIIKKYPSSWEEKYQIEAKDKTVCQLVIEELKGSSWKSPSTIVKPINESDNKILKRLKT